MTSSFRYKPAFLLLADGTLLEGKAFGHCGTVYGEVVFNTGMTGYQEVITDPSYFGQLITFTYPEIGNTGVNLDDVEASSVSAKGIIVRQFSAASSSWRAEETFESWLIDNEVVGICGVDTRALVRHLREFGSMNGAISSDEKFTEYELLRNLKETPSMEGLNLAKEVSTISSYKWNQISAVKFDQRLNKSSNLPFRVVAIDFGIKRSILQRLVSHGCEVTVLPADSNISKVLENEPEGIFLSNGPGDPSAVTEGIQLTKDLIGSTDLPIFGICLGHQIIGLALGAKTFKLNYGHRGLNHPCGKSGHLEITSQNHGFAIDAETLPNDVVKVSHLNLNDRTVAGITFIDRPIFGVQYHPEASPGPHDADHHFSRFVSLMKDRR